MLTRAQKRRRLNKEGKYTSDHQFKLLHLIPDALYQLIGQYLSVHDVLALRQSQRAFREWKWISNVRAVIAPWTVNGKCVPEKASLWQLFGEAETVRLLSSQDKQQVERVDLTPLATALTRARNLTALSVPNVWLGSALPTNLADLSRLERLELSQPKTSLDLRGCARLRYLAVRDVTMPEHVWLPRAGEFNGRRVDGLTTVVLSAAENCTANAKDIGIAMSPIIATLESLMLTGFRLSPVMARALGTLLAVQMPFGRKLHLRACTKDVLDFISDFRCDLKTGENGGLQKVIDIQAKWDGKYERTEQSVPAPEDAVQVETIAQAEQQEEEEEERDAHEPEDQDDEGDPTWEADEVTEEEDEGDEEQEDQEGEEDEEQPAPKAGAEESEEEEEDADDGEEEWEESDWDTESVIEQ